jgi:hypothetical protein
VERRSQQLGSYEWFNELALRRRCHSKFTLTCCAIPLDTNLRMMGLIRGAWREATVFSVPLLSAEFIRVVAQLDGGDG